MSSELEVLAAGQRDVRRFTVHRCGIERTDERLTVVRADRRTIEPVHSMQRGADGCQRPLPVGGVGDRKMRDSASRVVAGDDPVARRVPVVVAHRIGRGPGGHRLGRPVGAHGHGLQLQAVSLHAFAAPRNLERDGGVAFEGGDREAVIVETLARKGLRGPALIGGQRRRGVRDRIEKGLVRPSSLLDHAVAIARPEEVADRCRFAGTEVDHAPPCGAPGLSAACADVDSIFI